MARLKKPTEYINKLRLNPDLKAREIGENLRDKYQQWTRNLHLRDLLSFMQSIQDNKNQIGTAQLFGKFRAYSLEEFVYRLIRAKLSISRSLEVYWGEKCLVWRGNGREYGMELDILVGRKLNQLVEPVVAIDTKVELDASRLKTTLASFVLVKRWNLGMKCFLVYMIGETDPILLKLAEPWIDGIYEFGLERDETEKLIESIQEALSRF